MRCFLGGVTPNGFRNEFAAMTERNDLYGYILKGGPGTGKSSLMKRLAEEYSNCDIYCCSSDLNSIDAVVFPEKGIYIADGTSPHVMEPKYPALSGEYINLGEFWDENKIRPHRAALEYCFGENAAFHKRAARFVSAAGELFGGLCDYAKGCVLEEKLEAFVARFARKTFGKVLDIEGKAENRQLSAITSDGYFTQDIDKDYMVVAVSDDYFAAGSEILRQLSAQAISRGLSVYLSHCRIVPSNPIEAVLVPEKKLAFMCENFLNKKHYDCLKRINGMRFYDTNKLFEKKQKLSFDKSAGLELCFEASASISAALKVHDEIEKYYINAMDFSKTEIVYRKISQALNGE